MPTNSLLSVVFFVWLGRRGIILVSLCDCDAVGSFVTFFSCVLVILYFILSVCASPFLFGKMSMCLNAKNNKMYENEKLTLFEENCAISLCKFTIIVTILILFWGEMNRVF